LLYNMFQYATTVGISFSRLYTIIYI